jgi:hypothetical protein
MATAQFAMARRDTMTTTMATGYDDNGTGAMGDEVDDDGNRRQ